MKQDHQSPKSLMCSHSISMETERSYMNKCQGDFYIPMSLYETLVRLIGIIIGKASIMIFTIILLSRGK